MPDLLIELFSEEIPARMQTRAAADLQRLMTGKLTDADLTFTSAAAFSTPRRLCLTIEGLSAESHATREERKGPRVDAPEKALAGFLRSTGLSQDQLEQRADKKGDVWFAVIEKPGRPASEIVAGVLEDTLRTFPWPKSMRWGSGDLKWVRPLHAILCILTDEAGTAVVPLDVDGIASGASTRGHRFMAPDAISVTGFEDYAAQLKRAHVILDATERANAIWHDATNQAFAQGLEVIEDKGLLAEVAGLVEWPVVLMGEIGADFLSLPAEVLQTSMKEHQKFFSVREASKASASDDQTEASARRIVKFVTVANRETADEGATILAGNEKVLSARLSDAKFFWENDLRVAKAGMQPWLEKLGDVTFHRKLGSQQQRIERLANLARELAPMVGADPDMAMEAASVCKADLASEMVYEFPELQGVMGRYYAKAAGLPPDVAKASQEHYAPLGPSDTVPSAPVSVTAALADKLDMLTGFWAINERPTGSKDPFALRRAALGVIRLILSNDLRIRLGEAISLALKPQPLEGLDDAVLESRDDAKLAALRAVESNTFEWDAKDTLRNDLMQFLHDRLKVHLRDEGIPHDVIDACLATSDNDDLLMLSMRARALAAFLKTDDGENLVQGFKRANNVLSQAEDADGVEYSFGADRKLADSDEERALFDMLETEGSKIKSAIEDEDFAAAMSGMASLREPVDAFFEAVQVNTDKQVIRRNRLNLLHGIRDTVGRVADLTRIQG